MINLRRVDYSDTQQATDLLKLMSEYAQDPMGGGSDLSASTKENLIPSLAKLPNAISILAYDATTPVGLINCFVGFSTFKCQPLINIHDVIVTKAIRNKGVAKCLFQEVEAIAKEMNCCKLTLEVLTGNIVAKHVYETVGFSPYELDPNAGTALFWEKQL